MEGKTTNTDTELYKKKVGFFHLVFTGEGESSSPENTHRSLDLCWVYPPHTVYALFWKVHRRNNKAWKFPECSEDLPFLPDCSPFSTKSAFHISFVYSLSLPFSDSNLNLISFLRFTSDKATPSPPLLHLLCSTSLNPLQPNKNDTIIIKHLCLPFFFCGSLQAYKTIWHRLPVRISPFIVFKEDFMYLKTLTRKML